MRLLNGLLIGKTGQFFYANDMAGLHEVATHGGRNPKRPLRRVNLAKSLGAGCVKRRSRARPKRLNRTIGEVDVGLQTPAETLAASVAAYFHSPRTRPSSPRDRAHVVWEIG